MPLPVNWLRLRIDQSIYYPPHHYISIQLSRKPYAYHTTIKKNELHFYSSFYCLSSLQPEPSLVSFSVILCHTQYYFEFKANEAHFSRIDYLLGRGVYVMVHMLWYTRFSTKLASNNSQLRKKISLFSSTFYVLLLPTFLCVLF